MRQQHNEKLSSGTFLFCIDYDGIPPFRLFGVVVCVVYQLVVPSAVV